jgi:4-coumarate--CoA ligase
MVHEMAAELAARPLDVSCVTKIQVGGDAVTKDILMKCAALFPRAHVCVNHGMTEGGGSFMWPFFKTPTADIPYFGEICPIGIVASGSVVRIWDPEKERIVKRGELGELHISSPSIIPHYLGGTSEKSFYNERGRAWFNTGDIGMMDRNGLVFILGRRKDMMKRAGVAIMPAALESSIEALTGAQVRIWRDALVSKSTNRFVIRSLSYLFPILNLELNRSRCSAHTIKLMKHKSKTTFSRYLVGTML